MSCSIVWMVLPPNRNSTFFFSSGCNNFCSKIKMSSNLTDDWNDIVDFKISPKDLKQPSSSFFQKALTSYLAKLNITAEKLKSIAPEYESERLYLIRFCFCVDELYKLSDPSNNFYYMDFKRPSK